MLLYHINENIVRMKNSIFTRKTDLMNTKLTLSMDDVVIEKAKQYAALHNISLSKLVEQYFDSLENSEVLEITPIVRELSGIITSESANLPKTRLEYLAQKHA